MEFSRKKNSGLNSARPYVPSNHSGEMECMMIDLILGNIQSEITRIEDEAEKKRQNLLKETKSPDYSWLIDWKLKSRKFLGCRESSEIEFLCAKVKPNEWNRLIQEFRLKVKYIDAREEVLILFRKIVNEICLSRYTRESSIETINELRLDNKLFEKTSEQSWANQKLKKITSVYNKSMPQHQELLVFTLNRDNKNKFYNAHDSV